MTFPLDLVLRVAAVAALGWWCLGRSQGRSAATLHRMALGWLIAATVLVPAATLLPRIELPLLAALPAQTGGTLQVEPAPLVALFDTFTDPAPAAVAPPIAVHSSAPFAFPWAWIWGAGTVALLLRALGSRVALARLAGRLEPIEARSWRTLVQRLARDVGMGRDVRLLAMDADVTPAAFGALRPTIVLPRRAASWRGDKLACVLFHELAHLTRRDPLTRLVAELCCALFWFLPPVWILEREARAASERASDDVVLGAGARPSRYASLLLSLREGLGHPFSPMSPAPCLAAPRVRPSEFEGRLQAILDPARSRGASPNATFAGAMALVAAVIFSTVDLVHAQVASPAPISGDVQLAVVSPPAPSIAATMAVPHPAVPAAPASVVEPTPSPELEAAHVTTEEPKPSPPARPRRLQMRIAVISVEPFALKRPAHPPAPLHGQGIELFARERHHDYQLATFSFEHGTRDDRGRTMNDWDLQLKGHRAPYTFDVRMTGSDRSRLIDLGPVALDGAVHAMPVLSERGTERVEVIEGHTYLVHTVDSNSDHWACLRVTDLSHDGRCRFDWRTLAPPPSGAKQ